MTFPGRRDTFTGCMAAAWPLNYLWTVGSDIVTSIAASGLYARGMAKAFIDHRINSIQNYIAPGQYAQLPRRETLTSMPGKPFLTWNL